MPRKKGPVAQHIEQTEAQHAAEDASFDVAQLEAMPPTPAAEVVVQAVQQAVAQDKEAGQEEEAPRLRKMLSRYLESGEQIHLVDDLNRGGLGIKFENLGDNVIPTTEVRDVLKADGPAKMGFRREMDSQWRTKTRLRDDEADLVRDDATKRWGEVVKAAEEGRGFEQRPAKGEVPGR